MKIENYIKYYRILSRAYFHLPLLVYFLYENNYSFKQILILILTYSVTSLVLLLLKGKVSFRNIKNQLFISEISKIVGLLCFIFFCEYMSLLIIGQIWLSISYSLGIGVDIQIINSNFDKEESKIIQRNTNALMYPSLLLSAVIGSIAYVVVPTLPFILTLICSLVIIYTTKKVSINTNGVLRSNEVNGLKQISYLHIYYALSRGIVLTLFVSLIPYMLLTKSVSVVLFVVILSFYTLSGYISSKYYFKLSCSFNVKLILSITFIICGCILLFINSVVSILFCLILFGLGAGMVRPITLEKVSGQQSIRYMEILYFITNIIILVILLI